uniref:CID domain-containing protein n=1 Tax=Heterorhabditis bacteriophora TaxID=37862 RepID=A0A1I7XBI9_HETBA
MQDHGTCCLASGLCTVHSNRIYKAAENFVKVVEQMFESEILTATFSKMALLPSDETPKKIAKTSNGIKGRKIATAVRRHTSPPARPPPADYAVTLAETDGGDNSDLDVEDIRGGSVTGEDMEQQMRELLSEINHCRVHDLILDKIESMEREPNTSSIGLRALLVQLFNYSQTLSVGY